MSRVEISVEPSAELLRGLERAPEAIAWALDRAVQRAALEAAREMRRGAPKAFSTLTQSTGISRLAEADFRVGPSVLYAAAVERGTRGGGRMPPLQSILDWVRVRRLRAINPRLRRRELAAEQRSLAWAIARSIQRRGTPAQPFVGPVARGDRLRQRLQQLAREAVLIGLRRAGLA